MLVKYEYDNKIIADAELSFFPKEEETVIIYGESYIINYVTHEVEIKRAFDDYTKKVVVERIICSLYKENE